MVRYGSAMMAVEAALKAKNTSTRSDKLNMIPFPVTVPK
jgi:hypothetical protein